jgi:hypothetical protein
LANEIPEHTAKMAGRLLAAYCARICPPHARHAVQLAWRLEPDRAIVEELRPICGVAGTRRAVPLAQFRYRAASADWVLLHATDARLAPLAGEQAVRWRRYAPKPAARSLVQLLRELDADPHGLFWNRIDGKSLRWCTSRGRCAGCDEQYCRVLGQARSPEIMR